MEVAMSKLRQNIVTGKWVVIAPERAKRPEDFVMAAAPKRYLDDKCPFCLTNPEGSYQFSIKAIGGHEVIVLKDHQKELYEGGWELLDELFGVYQNRYLHFQKDPTI